MELISKRAKELWNVWGVRQVIMLSLLCQIILTIFGSKRNRSKSSWMRIILWFAYMASDSAAKFLLGTMVRADEDSTGSISTESIQLRAFWASFLLLHLGGPDTIAAYSLEDNELWSRSCLGMVVYVGVAFYILLTYWSNNLLGYISIPMFFVGTVKYVERIWSLRSKSKEHVRDHITFNAESLVFALDGSREVRENSLFEAYALSGIFLCRFFLKADADLWFWSMHTDVMRRYRNREAEDVFRLLQTELRLVYQVLYTKATVFSSLLGILIRSISFILPVATLVIFLTLHAIAPKGSYQITDIVITCCLLIGAIFVEVCSFVILFSSDWRKLWLLYLDNPNRTIPDTKCKKARRSLALFMTRYPSLEMDPRNWSLSETMGQYNLISSCLKKATSHRLGVRCLLSMYEKLEKLLNVSCINAKLEKHLNVSWVRVTPDLQQWMFYLSKEKNPAGRDRWRDNLIWSIIERWNVPDNEDYRYAVRQDGRGLGDNILTWHIATDICLHMDDDFRSQEGGRIMDICRGVSDYMCYLHAMHPSMISLERREIHTGAYSEVYDQFLEQFNNLEGDDEQGMIYDKLLRDQQFTRIGRVLYLGSELARQLQQLQSRDGWNYNRKWEMICDVWGEMLVHVAIQGDWEQHVRQLRTGGELLTYLRLLIFHYGELMSVDSNLHYGEAHVMADELPV